MKTAWVCAFFFVSFSAWGREAACTPRSSGLAASGQTVVVAWHQPPAPVAEYTKGNGPTVGGVFVRLASAPRPIQMLNPLAPPEYGSARNLVSVSADGNRSGNLNKRVAEQPDGIRLLTVRPPNW